MATDDPWCTAAGKTNLLEAIFVAAALRSFRTANCRTDDVR
jgi:recombinational DNA repair ATPase RecF